MAHYFSFWGDGRSREQHASSSRSRALDQMNVHLHGDPADFTILGSRHAPSGARIQSEQENITAMGPASELNGHPRMTRQMLARKLQNAARSTDYSEHERLPLNAAADPSNEHNSWSARHFEVDHVQSKGKLSSTEEESKHSGYEIVIPNHGDQPGQAEKRTRSRTSFDNAKQWMDMGEQEQLGASKLEELQRQLGAALHHIVQLEAENATVQKISDQRHCELKIKDKENTALKNDNVAVKKHLESCKEQIFHLQPKQHLSDADIASRYKDLYIHISDTLFENFADLATTVIWLARAVMAYDQYDLFYQHLPDTEVGLVYEYPRLDGLLLTKVLLGFLSFEFIKDISAGLPEDVKEFLAEVTNAMLELTPKREPEEVKTWTSEVTRAMQQASGLSALRKGRVLEVRQSIDQVFRTAFGLGMDWESEHFLRSVNMAAAFGEDIWLCTGNYCFINTVDPQTPETQRILTESTMKDFEIIDADTGAPLRSRSRPLADHGGRVGIMLCSLRPALLRRSGGNKSTLILVKETIAVAFDRAIPSSASHQGNAASNT